MKPGEVALNDTVDVTMPEPVVSEPVLSNPAAVEMKQKPSVANAQTKLDDEIDRQTLATGADAGPGYGEKREQQKLIERSKAALRNSREADPLPSNVSVNGKQVNEEKRAEKRENELSAEKLWNEDHVQEGFGVVSEVAPEIPVVDEAALHSLKNREDKDIKTGKAENIQDDFEYQASLGDVPDVKMDWRGESNVKKDEEESELPLQGDVPDLERFEKTASVAEEEPARESSLKTERGETFERAIPEELKELYGKAIDLQKACDVAGAAYAKVRGREDSLRTKVFRALPFLKNKVSVKDEEGMQNLKKEWQVLSTELRQVKIEIAKREAEKKGLSEQDVKKKMAEALIEGDMRGAMKVFEEWKEAKRGDRRESKMAKYVEDLVKRYRELPPGLKISIGLALFAVSFIPGTKPMVLVLGIPMRGLGAAGVAEGGKGLTDRIAAWFSEREKKTEVAREWSDADLRNLQEQSTRIQEKFDTLRKKDVRRTVAWAGVGLALFAGGTVFSLMNAAKAAEHIGSGGKVTEAVQKLADTKGPDLSGSVAEVVGNPGNVAGVAARGAAEIPAVPGAIETMPPVSGTEGLASEVAGAGAVDHGAAAEIAGKIGKNFSETATVPKDGSFEKLLIEKLAEHGVPKDAAGSEAHRAMLDLARGSGKSLEIFNHAQPGAEIQYEIGSDGSLHVFGVTRRVGGEVIKRLAESGVGQEAYPVSSVELPQFEKATELMPVKPVDLSELQSASELKPIEGMAPPDIFERATELKPLEPIALPEIQTVADQAMTPGNVPLPEPIIVPSVEMPTEVKVAAGVGAGAMALGGAVLAGAELTDVMNRRKTRRKDEGMKKNRKSEEKSPLMEEEREKIQEKARGVFDQIFSIASFPDDRKKALRGIQEGYATFSEFGLKEAVFEETRRKITTVFFGSEDIPENVLDNMFLAVAQQGIGDPENKRLEEIRTGIKNGYSVFQVLFGKTGERLPAEKITGLSVREVLRLFTERFLTGRTPEELLDSAA